MLPLSPTLALTAALVAGPGPGPGPAPATSFFAREGAVVTTVGLSLVGAGAVLGAGGLAASLLHTADDQRLEDFAATYAREGSASAGRDVVNERVRLGPQADRERLQRVEVSVVVAGGALAVAGWVITLVGARALVDGDGG
jgi:hypothetical protein